MKKAFLTSLLRITPVIQNVVTTVDFNVVLDLRKVALKAKNTEYNPKVFKIHSEISCINNKI